MVCRRSTGLNIRIIILTYLWANNVTYIRRSNVFAIWKSYAWSLLKSLRLECYVEYFVALRNVGIKKT